MNKILVWDLPTRVGHWLLVASFAIAWLTGESETFRLVHVAAGYVMAAVLGFRLFWGIFGTRYARITSFLFSPRQALDYLAGLVRGEKSHWVGHNPAGSYAIYLLVLFGFASAGSGWLAYNDFGGEWLEEFHEILASAMLGVVCLHVAGVVVSGLLHRENLVRSMINGYKTGSSDEAISSKRMLWAVLLVGLAGWAAVAAFMP
jgi:cytochrome b